MLFICYSIACNGQINIETFFKQKFKETPVKRINGVFNTYKVLDKYYWEIPQDMLGRDFALTTTIIRAPALMDRNWKMDRYGYAGDLFGPSLIRFTKKKKHIYVSEPLNDVKTLSGSYNLNEINRQKGDIGIYDRFEIEAIGNNSFLIDITNLITNHNLFNVSSYSYFLAMGYEDKNLFEIKDIKGFDSNIIIKYNRAFDFKDIRPSLKNTSKQYKTNWEIGISMSLLPKKPLKIRLKNSRVGYFSDNIDDFRTDPHRVLKRRIIKRWRIEPYPSDVDKYLRGELVEPMKPIVFYIDRNTPKKWVPYLIDAVNAWQVAFEQAGFKNAIYGRLAPSKVENSNFSEHDPKYSFISWKASPQSNAYGPITVDPRSGEVITSHIGIFSSVLELLGEWYFSQCANIDNSALQTVIPDTVMGNLIKMVVSHEVGHTLGLEHNFIGSSLYSVEQLRNNSFLNENGMGSSIMDYMRLNYVARKEDNIDNYNLIAKIGAYDKFAIEWGYRYFHNKTLEQETAFLNKWVVDKQTDKRLRFSDSYDPRVQKEDLGNDNVESNRIVLDNIKKLVLNDSIWAYDNNMDFNIKKKRYKSLLIHYEQYVGHVIENIGGIMYDKYGSLTDSIYPTKYDKYEDIMQFLKEYVFVDLDWLYSNGITKRYKINGDVLLKRFYTRYIGEIVNKQNNIIQYNELKTSLPLYSLSEYIYDLHNIIFYDWTKTSKINHNKLYYQQEYIEMLKKNINNKNYIPSEILEYTYVALEKIKEDGLKYVNRRGDNSRIIDVFVRSINL